MSLTIDTAYRNYGSICNATTPKPQPKSEENGKYDVIEISKEGLEQLQIQQGHKAESSKEETNIEDVAQLIEEETSVENLVEEEKTEETQESEEETHESTSVGTSMGINVGKLARKLAAARTREQVQAVMQEIRQDIDECEAGREHGATVEEANINAAKNLLSQASQKVSQVSNHEATPEEEMAFLMAGLM